MALFAKLFNKRQTSPANPTAARRYYGSKQAGMWVDDHTALTFSAVWGCVRIISETLASCPWNVFERLSNGGSEKKGKTPLNWLLSRQPNPEMNSFTFRETLCSNVLLWGNAYAEVVREGATPTAIYPIDPSLVDVQRDKSGNLVYLVYQQDGTRTIESWNMFHIKGLGNGLVGHSVVGMAAKSIGMGLAMEMFGNSFFANGTHLSGVLTHPEHLSDAAYTRLKAEWQENYGGPYASHSPAILEEGMKWEPISIKPEDAQFLGSRQFQVLEICRWFRVPPHKLAELSRATHTNIEHQSIEFVVDTILPWAIKFEYEADLKLMTTQAQRKWFTKINLNGLMRGDSSARAQYYKELFNLGVYSINEIRDLEEMNPIGDVGDQRFMQLNMTTIDKIGEEQDEDSVTDETHVEAPTTEDVTVEAETESNRLAPFRHILNDVCQRIVRREHYRFSDACKRLGGNAEAIEDWLRSFWAEHNQYVEKALRPPMMTIAESLGIPDENITKCLHRSVDLHYSVINHYMMYWIESEQADSSWDVDATGLIFAQNVMDEIDQCNHLDFTGVADAVA